MQPIQIDLIAGARPNFMKIAPLYHVLSNDAWCSLRLVHTGQHYDEEMSSSFFNDLRLPPPDVSLQIGSGSHTEQTAKVLIGYEKCIQERRPDLTIVVGDVNS